MAYHRAAELAGQAEQADTDYLVAYWRRLRQETGELANQIAALQQEHHERLLHQIAISQTLLNNGVDTSELVGETYGDKAAGDPIEDEHAEDNLPTIGVAG